MTASDTVAPGCPDGKCIYNYDKMNDIVTFKQVHDDTWIYRYIRWGWHPFNYWRKGYYYPFGSYPFSPHNDTGHNAPVEFNHTQVYCIDIDEDGKYDYYVATRHYWPAEQANSQIL